MRSLAIRGAVICGVDGSLCSLRAARVAGALAQVLDVPLLLAHVLGAGDAGLTGPERSAQVDGAAVLAAPAGHERVEAVAADAGSPVEARKLVLVGNPARRLAALAEHANGTMIVVGTRGQVGARDALLGSVASQLAADAPCPVVVVPSRAADVREAGGLRSGEVVCGYDGSPSARLAACAAAALGTDLGGRLRLVAVNADAMGLTNADLAHALHASIAPVRGSASPRPRRLEVRVEARRGDPAEQLEATAAAATEPFLVVGSRGLEPWGAPLVGSVSRRVLRIARRPVMVVPATMSGSEVAA